MSLNFQDVIRDVHDPANHALQISGTIQAAGQATITLYNTPTIYAVVNTGGATNSTLNIGFATVSVSNPTLYAVVNTTASSGLATIDVRNTINANVSLSNSISNIGFATVFISTPTLYSVVNVPSSISINGNVTLDDGSKTIIVDPTGAELDLMKEGDNFAAGSDHGVAILGLKDGTPKTYEFIRVEAVNNDGETPPDAGVISAESYAMLFNGSTFDRIRTANAANATTGLGTFGAGILGFDGTNYRRVRTDGNGILAGNVTLANQPALVASNANIGSVSVLGGTVNSVLQSSTLNVGSVSILGGVVGLGAGVANIGFASVTPISAWPDPKTYIGLVTVANTVTVAAHSLTASTANIGSVSVLGGGIGLNTGANFIGIVTVTNQQPLVAGTANIGCVTLLNQPALTASAAFIGITTVANQQPLVTGTSYIGLVTANIGTTKAWTDPNTFIGLVTVAPHSLTASTLNIGSVSVLGGSIKLDTNTLNIGSVSVLGGSIKLDTNTLNIGSVSVLGGGIGINAGVNNIGFATVTLSPNGNPSVFAVNVGTNKTLINLPIGFSASSIATIAVPTNANTIKITNMLLNSDATVRFTMKSGVTYLTGNASIGVTLNPGGGFIMTGSPDSPSWIGLPSGALVLEKLDLTGTAAKIGGNVVYWQE